MAKARSEDMQSELQRLERLQNATRPDARPESIISQLNSVAPLFLVGMAPCGKFMFLGRGPLRARGGFLARGRTTGLATPATVLT